MKYYGIKQSTDMRHPMTDVTYFGYGKKGKERALTWKSEKKSHLTYGNPEVEMNWHHTLYSIFEMPNHWKTPTKKKLSDSAQNVSTRDYPRNSSDVLASIIYEIGEEIKMTNFYTDYPILELGDKSGEIAPIRPCKITKEGKGKYCDIEVEGIKTSIKKCYIYRTPNRCGEVPNYQNVRININVQRDIDPNKLIKFLENKGFKLNENGGPNWLEYENADEGMYFELPSNQFFIDYARNINSTFKSIAVWFDLSEEELFEEITEVVP